jgi:phosphocarrier protein HPr
MSADGTHLETRVRIRNRAGLHARPAAALVKVAGRFRSEIKIARDGLSVDGKSILGVMMLAAEQGVELTLTASGGDAEAALDALVQLVNSGFGEEGDPDAEDL